MIGKFDENRYKASAHEAGHAFLAKFTGRIVSNIVLNDDGSAITTINWGQYSPIEAAFRVAPKKILGFKSDWQLYLEVKSSILVAGPICELLPKYKWDFGVNNIAVQASGPDLALLNVMQITFGLNVQSVMTNIVGMINKITIPEIKRMADFIYANGGAKESEIDAIYGPLISRFLKS